MKEVWHIIKYSKKLWPYYVAIACLIVVYSLLQLAVPFLTKGLIDGLTSKFSGNDVQFTYFLGLIGLMLLAGQATNIIGNINGYLGDNMSAKLNNLLSENYFAHLVKLPVSFYDNAITGKITARLERSITGISQLMQSLSNNFVQFFLTTIITLAVIAFYSWPVAVLLLVIFPLYLWVTHLSSSSWQKRQEEINKERDISNGRFVESIAQIRVLKSFVTESRELNFFGKSRRIIEAVVKKQSKKWHAYDLIRQALLGVVFAGIYCVIIWQAYSGQYGLGTVVLLITLVNQAQWPLFGSSWIIEALQRATSDSRDYFEIMNTEPAIADRPDAEDLQITDARVEYKAVDFAYNGNDKVLKSISFAIEPGKKIALVGESGEGKSTIANLLLRFYEANGGRITIDGQGVNDVTQQSLRRQIGVVFQEPQLFSGTVRENVTYGQNNVPEKDMIEAAKAANAYDFIKKLPKGFDTEIGERGVKLSGGQKQRIAIARAIMKNPPILILDEATSSLDSKAEHEVQEALERLMQNRTTMIIAHRLSTIEHVDMIVGLKGGKVSQVGTPEQLSKKKGIYAELLELQTIGAKDRRKAALKKYDLAG